MRNSLIFLLLLAGCSTVNPESFDYPFQGKTYTHYLSPANMASFCGSPASGCSFSSGRGTPDAICYIYINSAYRSSKSWLACIKKHENRHCNGYQGEANAC